MWASDQLTLLAVSPTLCKREDDWPGYYQVCGFLNPQNNTMDGEISGELQEFLSSGTPPVYMVFGSGMTCHERDTISLLSETAKKAPTRAVIQAPNWKEYGFKSTDRVHFVSSAPHTAIFPQCSVIVHHGGAGTSQTALLAGTPVRRCFAYVRASLLGTRIGKDWCCRETDLLERLSF